MDDGRYPQAVAPAQSVRWVARGLFPASFGRSRASRPAADAARFALFFKRNPEIRVVPAKEFTRAAGSEYGPGVIVATRFGQKTAGNMNFFRNVRYATWTSKHATMDLYCIFSNVEMQLWVPRRLRVQKFPEISGMIEGNGQRTNSMSYI